MFSVLRDKIFPGKQFYQPLVFKLKLEVRETQTNFKLKFILNGFFAHSLTRFHAQRTTFFQQFDNLYDFQKL